jgi:hypothetical protein
MAKFRQFIQQSRSRFALWIFLFILASRLAQANDPHQVGLVVVHGDGAVTSQCLTFQGEEISGYELLEQSKLDLNIDASNSMGATICRLDGEGCNYPQDDCFCQCQSSRNCIYWSYWHLEGGQWQYSSLGASTILLHGGEVQGWVWSKGSVGSSADKAPPSTSFEAICAPPPTDTPIPTETATATLTPRPTDTASPTATDTPNPPTLTPTSHPANTTHEFDEVGLATTPTITPTATNTPTITVATATVTPTPTPIHESRVTPQPAVSPAATASPTPSPTATEPVTLSVAASQVAPALPSPTRLEILPTATRPETLLTPTPPLPPPESRGGIALSAVATLPPLAIEKRHVSPTDSSAENTTWLIFGSLASMLLLFMLALPLMLLMLGGVVWWVGGRKK